MKTIQPTFETIKTYLNEDKNVFIRLGKDKIKIQKCYKNKTGTVYALSSIGEHRIDLFSELYVE
jgi:hypothetical protein